MKHWLMVSCAVCALSGAPALAQDGGAASDGRSAQELQARSDDIRPGDIVVTAQKREQRLLDVPNAVTAFTSVDRDKLGIVTAQDLAAFTPSLSISNDPPRVFLRGVGQNSGQRSSDPGVAVYYDGVYSSTAALAVPSIITERTEVLRGPQGTLYGKNTTGGAINVISKRPTREFTGEFRENLGNYERSTTGLTLSGPIADWLRYRVTGTYNYQGEGFIDNVAGKDFNTGSSYNLEAQIEADITSNLRLWVKYSHGSTDQVGGANSFSFPYDTTTETFDGYFTINPHYKSDIPNPGVTHRRRAASDLPPSLKAHSNGITVNLDWDVGANTTLRYIGAYTKSKAKIVADIDNSARTEPFVYDGVFSFVCAIAAYNCLFSPVTRADIASDPEVYSNEINLISNGEGSIDYVLGLYQYHERALFTSDLRRPDQPALAPQYFVDNPRGTYILVSGGQKNLTYAGFGQVDWHLNDQWTLQIGGRYTYDRKQDRIGIDRTFSISPLGFLINSQVPFLCVDRPLFCELPTGPASQLTRSFEGWTGRLALQWQPDANTNVFALISRGYKSGAITDAALGESIPAETLIDYEVGLKKRFGDSLSVDLAAYYYDYKDIQIQTNGPDRTRPGNFTTVYVSAPKARSYGFEAEVNWNMLENLDAIISYSYMNAKILELKDVLDLANQGAGLQDVSGNRIPQSPKHKLTANLGYTFELEPGSLRLSGTYNYTSKKYFDIFSNNPLYKGKAFEQVDLRAYFTERDNNYTVIAYVANLFNKDAANYVSLVNGTAQVSYALNQPRTYGVELQVRF